MNTDHISEYKCDHFSKRFEASCIFCGSQSCKKCGNKCDECTRACCGNCLRDVGSKSRQCPTCAQGVMSEHFIMSNNKDCGRCACTKICLPVKSEEIRKDNYDRHDYMNLGCALFCAFLCIEANTSTGHGGSLYQPMPVRMFDSTDSSTKWVYYRTKYYCSRCDQDFYLETKRARMLSM